VAAALEAARRSLGTAAAAATPANNASSGESLGDILARVANSERDVVAVYANLAFADLTRNLVCHLRRLNMSNFFVLALDGQLCEAIGDLRVPCFFDARFGAGFQQHERWTNALKSHYFRMLQLKLSYVSQVLALGYNLLLSDADTVYVSDRSCTCERAARGARRRPADSERRAPAGRRLGRLGVRRQFLHSRHAGRRRRLCARRRC
jgi:hypothetical protein